MDPRLTESLCADKDACAPRESGTPRSTYLPAKQRSFRGGGLKRILSLLVLLALLPLSFALSESADPVIINRVVDCTLFGVRAGVVDRRMLSLIDDIYESGKGHRAETGTVYEGLLLYGRSCNSD